MARTPSTMMLEHGAEAPAFTLPDPSGATHSLADVRGEHGLLVMFICNHCPFVKLIREELAKLGREAQDKGVGVVAIMPNDVENYPDDSPAKMAEEVEQIGYTFPYLYDESQEVAKAYKAACTPDFFLFDADLKLFYKGQLDDARPGGEHPVTGADLRGAVAAMLAGRPAPDAKPSVGCNIKWKAGNEPAYVTA